MIPPRNVSSEHADELATKTTRHRAKRFTSVSFGKVFVTLLVIACLLPIVAAQETSSSAEAGTCTEAQTETRADDKKDASPPGLYTALHDFTPSPKELRRTVCMCPDTEAAVYRAFKSRGWNIIALEKPTNGDPVYLECHKKGLAGFIWTKSSLPDWWEAQPWQRHNWLATQNQMTHKGHFQRNLLEHEARTGRKMPFVPDTYLLPADRERLLKRLQPQTGDNPEGGGFNEPWVIKLSATDNGVGVAIYGPESEGVEILNRTLVENENPEEFMMPLREALVLRQQENDLRDPDAIERARQRSLRQNDDIVVQRYICHEMDYQGRKFDLRLYYLVASVDPLVVYYHDGALRVSLSMYNDKVFDSTTDHLTNLGRNDAMDNCTISLPDWEVELKAHVAKDPSRFPPEVAKDPLTHVRNQAKLALTELVSATRKTAFDGFGGYRTHMENVFALLGGDFIVDEDLHVWMTEAQSSPGYGHETKVRLSLYETFLPAAIDIVAEVTDKQMAGLPLFPMKDTGGWELIYTDDYQFTYDFKHKEQQRGPC